MAQSDQTVQNATFPAVRADINDNLAALFSQSSGPSAPTVTVAWQPWVDTSTTPAVWKVRNAANTGWLTVGTFGAAFQPAGLTAIANGGTGQVTATGAINALLPSQTGNSGKYLTTNGTTASWDTAIGSSVYEYTANNTWTKPSVGNFALVTIWGGGGSGGRNQYATGGGGGACVQRLYRLSELPSSVAITIGAGGAGRSGDGDGNTGGTTTFGSLLSAYGGAGGDATNSFSFAAGLGGGGGGGSRGAGSSSTGGDGHGPSLVGGDGASDSIAGKGDFGGGGGGASLANRNGGTAYWGGGGGGGRNDGTSSSGGVSLHGGSGSASNQNAAGGFPGGGSGATDDTTGAGGAGYCLIYVW